MRFFTTILALLLPSLALASSSPIIWNAACTSGAYNVAAQACLTSGGGGGSPGGSTTQVQYNSSGSFAGIPGLTYSSSKVGLSGVLNISNTTGSTVGMIQKGGSPWLHDFAATGTNGGNIFLGGGNLTLTGSSSGTQGSYNTVVGATSGNSLTTGNYNSLYGQQAGLDLTTGSDNSCFGAGACNVMTTAVGNAAFGYNTMESVTVNGSNSAFGYGSQALSDAINNTSIGFRSMKINTAGHDNTVAGFQAGYDLQGNYNVIIGSQATGSNITSGSNNILMGQDIQLVTATSSNQLNIGNLLFGTNMGAGGTIASGGRIGIGVQAPGYNLDVLGTGHFSGALTTNLGAGLVRSSSGGVLTSAEVSGDCTTSGSNAITCTKTNGVSFGTMATAATSAYAAVANNLSDLASAATARTNLGLGTAATQAATFFAQLGGVSGGQTLQGDTLSGGTLTLMSTAHATKGKILFGTSAYDEVNNRLCLRCTTPSVSIFEVHNTTDDVFLGSPTIIGQANNANATWALYATASTLGLYNKGYNANVWATNYLGEMTVGDATFRSPDAQLVIRKNTALITGGASNQSLPTVVIMTEVSDTGDLLQFMKSDRSTILSGFDVTGLPYIVHQGSSVTPTSTKTGALSLTSAFVLCVYNGSAWKKVSDGSTTCTF